jgi:hypothetical protein
MNTTRSLQSLPKKRKTQNKKPNTDLNQGGSLSPLQAPRLAFMPDQFRTILKFTSTKTLNLTVPGFQLVYYVPSGAFDVDPVIGSPTMAGFNQFAAFYNEYRVLGSKIRISYTNNSLVCPVNFYLMPIGSSPSGYGPVEIASMRGQPYCVWKTSPLLGGPTMNLTNQISAERITGTRAASWGDDYAALVTANPVNSWFWAIGIEYPVSNAVSSYLQVEIDVDLIFFDRGIVNRA